MIQRIQTVYLFLGAVLTVLCLCLQIGTFTDGEITVLREYNLWVIDALGTRSFTTWPLFTISIPSASLSLYTIFIYNNRIIQARLCLFNVLLLIGWYILYALYTQLLSHSAELEFTFSPTMAASFPACAIVLYMMARHSILADEKKVKDADRIR